MLRTSSEWVWTPALFMQLTRSIKTLQSFLQAAIFAGGVGTIATETKGTALIHKAQQALRGASSPLDISKVGELIKAIAGSGAKVIVSGAAVGEMALHFCERYKLMVLKISSKFELQRFCHTTGAVALVSILQSESINDTNTRI
ncbi:unnamed protein product [Coffea canephora]|uniref:DH200=94 genomic scaffold, scaffold_2050 n=1 Tax=Coffea canephora TaxID=49390 RepID=A0A068VJY5_COFCA|nr:unnamed protein product [Coffea canephora]